MPETDTTLQQSTPQWTRSLRAARDEVIQLRYETGRPVVFDGDPLKITWAEAGPQLVRLLKKTKRDA